MDFKVEKSRIAVIGLGYVGLPLAVEFGKQYPTLGFDVNQKRVAELKTGVDHTLETSSEELVAATQLVFSDQAEKLSDANIYIITVPTPLADDKHPDLSNLLKASEFVGSVIKSGDIVI